MQASKDLEQLYYKKMLDLQEKLRKSEEERIRLEERFNFLVQDSRMRHQSCINRLRIRYVEFLEEQRMRDERNNKLLGSLNQVDSSLALMSAKTERLNVLRKHYEAYLLRVYGTDGASSSESFLVTTARPSPNQRDQNSRPASIFSFKRFPTSTNDQSRETLSQDQRSHHQTLSTPPTRDYPTEKDDGEEKRDYHLPNQSNASMRYWGGVLPNGTDNEHLSTNSTPNDIPITKLTTQRTNYPVKPDLDSYIGRIRQLHANNETRTAPNGSNDGPSFEKFIRSGANLSKASPLSKEEEEEVKQQPVSSNFSNVELVNGRGKGKLQLFGAVGSAAAATAAVTTTVVGRQFYDKIDNDEDDDKERAVDAEIEDDYDESVDIDTWMPDEQRQDADDDDEEDDDELEEQQRQLQEAYLRGRPRRKLEAIEEVEQAEDELQAEISEEPISNNNRQTFQRSNAIDEDNVQQQQKQQNDQSEVGITNDYENTQKSDRQELPNVESAEQNQSEEEMQQQQYYADTGQYDQNQYQQEEETEEQQQQEYAYDNASGYNQYTTDNYDESQHQQQYYQQEYETEEQYVEEQHQYEQNITNSEYREEVLEYSQEVPDDGTQQQQQQQHEELHQEYVNETVESEIIDEAYEYAWQTENSGDQQQQQEHEVEATKSHVDEENVDDDSVLSSREAKLQQQEQSSKKKKKDVIKSILDSDSESLIERKLSNSESDFDFN